MKRSQRTRNQVSLGVKGRLSNEEMGQLRSQLAHAVAYNHASEYSRAPKSLAASKPMTRVYRRVESSQCINSNQERPARKTLASIQYEKQFIAKSYDSLKPCFPRGIHANAKTTLQDEYVTKPREENAEGL